MTAPNVMNPAIDGVAVTPHDTNNLATMSRSLYIGTGGNINVRTAKGNDLVITNIQDGSIIPIQVTRVYATSTTATGIVNLY